MGGQLENWIDRTAAKILPKIPLLGELSKKGKRQVTGSHITWMAAVTLAFDLGACLTPWTWLAWCSLASFGLVVQAEWGAQGRRIDWISRTVGWLIGAIPALLILL